MKTLQNYGLVLVLSLSAVAGCGCQGPSGAGPTAIKQRPAATPQQIKAAKDLLAEMKLAGYSSLGTYDVQKFVQYGDASKPVARSADAAQELRSNFYKLRLDVRMARRSDMDVKGAFVIIRLPMRIDQLPESTRGNRELITNVIDGGDRDAIQMISTTNPILAISNANASEFWFLTKDNSLRRCRSNADIREVKSAGGFLYAEDNPFSEIIFRYGVDRELAEEMTKNPRNFAAEIVVSDVRYAPPAQWGYYRHDLLVKHDWDSDFLADYNTTGALLDYDDLDKAPAFFPTEQRVHSGLVFAKLLACKLMRGNTIVSDFVAPNE